MKINILTFSPPSEKETLTFFFTEKATPETTPIPPSTSPAELIEIFGNQKEYHTSFCIQTENAHQITKMINPKGTKTSSKYFSYPILKRYYKSIITHYFKTNNYIIKPTTTTNTEIWILSQNQDTSSIYTYYDSFSLQVQFNTITNSPELQVSYIEQVQLFKESLKKQFDYIPPETNAWVIFENTLYDFNKLPKAVRRHYNQIHAVYNPEIAKALKIKAEPKSCTNKYITYKTAIHNFYTQHLNTPEFKSIINITSHGFINIEETRIHKIKKKHNKLYFGNDQTDNNQKLGFINNGPYEPSPTQNIHFFYILHKDDKEIALKINSYLKGNIPGFKGLTETIDTPYHPNKSFTIYINNKHNHEEELYRKLADLEFKPNIQYFAIYINPINKETTTHEQNLEYYKIKELLLENNIPSQVINPKNLAENIEENPYFTNIAVATLAKLNGIPWALTTNPKNQLIIGITTAKHHFTKANYIYTSICFTNTGKFHNFNNYHESQIKELSGEIILAVKEYITQNNQLEHLILHFSRTINQELIKTLKTDLLLSNYNIPIISIVINKYKKPYIFAYDTNSKNLMPQSGTFINLQHNNYLLYNNTQYSGEEHNLNHKLFYPVSLQFHCTEPEPLTDKKLIKQLITQIYQLSRIYYKSINHQPLPITIKYVQLLSQITLYFNNKQIPDFTKNSQWYV